jgi:hypothetical protein
MAVGSVGHDTAGLARLIKEAKVLDDACYDLN